MVGGGDYLVLRALGDDAYNPYIYAFGGAHSVSTLLTKDRAAGDDAFVVDRIDRAEALWFAGGDQWVYLQEWQGTKMQQAIQRAIARGVPIGGTSAGCDVQGKYIYSAPKARSTPRTRSATPSTSGSRSRTTPSSLTFRILLGSVLTDTHFVTRDRMGRLVAFLARLWKDGLPATAIGIDEQTAIAIDARGHGKMLRLAGGHVGRAYVVSPGKPAERCEKGEDLVYDGVAVQKLDAAEGDTFDFVSMSGRPNRAHGDPPDISARGRRCSKRCRRPDAAQRRGRTSRRSTSSSSRYRRHSSSSSSSRHRRRRSSSSSSRFRAPSPAPAVPGRTAGGARMRAAPSRSSRTRARALAADDEERGPHQTEVSAPSARHGGSAHAASTVVAFVVFAATSEVAFAASARREPASPSHVPSAKRQRRCAIRSGPAHS